jgi:DNA-binding GntR family transcriptional regulator
MNTLEATARVPEPLANFIAGELARAIERGEYKPGERLVETVIAARYEVSRAPVREALRLLARHELVTQRPRRGTVVVDLTPAEISEMFELRSALYAAVIRLFVRRASPADLETFTAQFHRIGELAHDPSVTPAQFVDATQASSVFVIARCGNRRLQDTFRKLTSQSYRYYAEMAHSTMATRQGLAGFAAEMVRATRAGDAETASMTAWRLHEANHRAALAAIAAKAEQEQS